MFLAKNLSKNQVLMNSYKLANKMICKVLKKPC